jgi:uncharacterized protein involved in outer membrane biogenesis
MPAGARDPAMLKAERIEVELQLLPLLLRREVLIDRLALDRAVTCSCVF